MSLKHQVGREKKKRVKNSNTTPFYNPNYDYVQKNLSQGVPLFEKQSSRKDQVIAKNCLNEYDLEDVERGEQMLGTRQPVPVFEKMHGR